MIVCSNCGFESPAGMRFCGITRSRSSFVECVVVLWQSLG
jgi:hypothetical protein